MSKRKSEKKELARIARLAAREERMKKVKTTPKQPLKQMPKDSLTEKRNKVSYIINNTAITEELLRRFSGAPLPLFLEPLPENAMGYRITYLKTQNVIMPSDEELEKLREYDDKIDYKQLLEMLSWNIRRVVIQQEENGDYEKEAKEYVMTQLFNQTNWGNEMVISSPTSCRNEIDIKNDRIVLTKGKRVYKTDTKYSDIDTEDLFYMKTEGNDPFGGPCWKPQFKKDMEEAVKELERRIMTAAANAKAETGQNSAYPELLKMRQIIEKWILLYGTQVRMLDKPLCYVKPFDNAEYAEDAFVCVKSENGKVEYIWYDNNVEEAFESKDFLKHVAVVNELCNMFSTRIRYKNGAGLMQGGTEIGIQITNGKNDETKFVVESMQHTLNGWESCLRESFNKLKEHYDRVRKEEWERLAEEYPAAFTDAISIRIAREILKGVDLEKLQNKSKYITAKEFNRRINLLDEAGVINVINAKNIRKGYGGQVWEMCSSPPENTGYEDVDSLKVYLEAKTTSDVTQRKIKILQCSGGFLSAYIDELQKEFKKVSKPIRDILEMKASSDKDKKRKEVVKILLKAQ